MDTRLSAPYNIRAAKLAMIPGGYRGIPINRFEGGEPSVEIFPREKVVTDKCVCGAPPLSAIGELREYDVRKYEHKPYAVSQTYTGTLAGKKMNEEYTRVPGAFYDVRNFDIIGSEKYPDPPIVWQTTIGIDSRQLGRTDGKRYTR
jgi:ribosomal protein L34E